MQGKSDILLKRTLQEKYSRYLPIASTCLVFLGAFAIYQFQPTHFAPAIISLSNVFNFSNRNRDESLIKNYNLTITDNSLFDTGSVEFNTSGKKITAKFESPSELFEEEAELHLITNNLHEYAFATSFIISFPNKNPFHGSNQLVLTKLPPDEYLAELFNEFRAKKIGLATHNNQLINLNVNGRSLGTFMASEPWSPSFLAKSGNFYLDDKIYSFDTFSSSIYSFTDNSWNRIDDNALPEEIDALKTILINPNNEIFEKQLPAILDLDAWYKFVFINKLQGTTKINNIVFVFSKKTGKFVPLPANSNIINSSTTQSFGPIFDRVLSNESFFQEYQKIVTRYIVADNLLSDNKYFNELETKYQNIFLQDQTTYKTKKQIYDSISELRNIILKNQNTFSDPFITISTTSEINNHTKIITNEEFTGSFSLFSKRFFSLEKFLVDNPEFKRSNDTKISLGEGKHIFSKSVVIPQETTLIISPGATLAFAPKTSLISYSPVIALGTADKPIFFQPLFADSEIPWGSFVVISEGYKKNIFHHVNISGGSSEKINGIVTSGELAIQNMITEIIDSKFTNAREDALHITGGEITINNSHFLDNSVDAIDLEFVENGLISNSVFFNNDYYTEDVKAHKRSNKKNNGDAIDIGMSNNIIIKDNIIYGFSDKGISAGEKSSNINIENTWVSKTGAGVLAKENSDVNIKNSIFINNKIGLDTYLQKKEYLTGGKIKADLITLWDNIDEIEYDSFSQINISNSTVQDGVIGNSISTLEPQSSQLIPDHIRGILENLNI